MNAIVDEKKVPENLLGNLNETSVNSSHELLNKNLNKDGYLFLKNVVASKEVELARNEVFKRLYEINEIKDPYNEGIFSGKSDRDVFYNDRGDFWKDVSELDSIRNITNGKILHNIFDNIFGSPSIGFDFIFLRPVANGKSTKMHCDSGFFTRKTKKVKYQIKNSPKNESHFQMIKSLEMSEEKHKILISYCKKKKIDFILLN